MIDLNEVNIDFENLKSSLFTIPELKVPERSPDFTIDRSNDTDWPNVTKYYLKERVLVFIDISDHDHLSMARLLIDEHYGIFADMTSSQNLKHWQYQAIDVQTAYVNLLITNSLLTESNNT